MKKLPVVMLLCMTPLAWSKTYVGIGTFQSEFWGEEFDRKYESDKNDIRQVSFGYKDKELIEFFGDVKTDSDNEVVNFALGIALKDNIIRIEQGQISGTIIDDDDNTIGEFDNQFKRIDILNRKPDHEGFLTGIGFQQYAVPHLFEYNDGSIQGPMLQDDALSFTSIGLGIFYDSNYNYLMSDRSGWESDWYFSTSTLAISLAYVESSDAPELEAREVDGQSWLMWGNSGTYEFGWRWGYQSPYASGVINLGYHLRANTFFNLDPSIMFATDADDNDIHLPGHQTILHGAVLGLNMVF